MLIQTFIPTKCVLRSRICMSFIDLLIYSILIVSLYLVGTSCSRAAIAIRRNNSYRPERKHSCCNSSINQYTTSVYIICKYTNFGNKKQLNLIFWSRVVYFAFHYIFLSFKNYLNFDVRSQQFDSKCIFCSSF